MESGNAIRAADEPADQAPELVRGACISRYVILALVGKGGMGEVYAAYDPELDRKIALKLLRAESSSSVDPSEGRTRLLREAQAIARLSDPNVVTVFDVGTFGDRVFLAMEFVDGNTLGYWLQSKTRTWREVVKVFRAAAQGLACAHKAGVVHRDFKPDNVMIGRSGDVRVMDFGLARTIEKEGEAVDGGRALHRAAAPDAALAVSHFAPAATAAAGAAPATPTGTTSSSTEALGIAAVVEGAPPVVFGGARPRATPATMRPASMRTSKVGGAARAGGTPAAPPAPWTEADLATRDLSKDPIPVMSEAGVSALNSPLTVTGAMMGTPAYMAPEQFDGKAIDARTDQFSFCVALYEGLFGERPFFGKNLQELSANVIAGRMRPPPAHAKVPGWLRRVVLRGLRTDRADRYASMELLMAELARDPTRRRRRVTAALAAVGAFAALGAGLLRAEQRQRLRCRGAEAKLVGIWELPTANGLSARKEAIRRAFMATGKRYAAGSFTVVMNGLDRYVTDWNDMHRDSCEATNIRGEQSAEVLDLRTSCLHDRFSDVRALTAVFSDANGEVVAKAVEAVQSLRTVEQCADIAALRAVVRPPDDPAVRRAVADVRTNLADMRALANAGRYKRALESGPALIDSARATKYQPVIAEVLLQVAHLEHRGGDGAKAERNYEDAVWTGEASGHAEVVVEAAAQLAFVVGTSGRYAEGERWAQHSGSVLQRLGPGHDMLAGWRANNLAAVLSAEGKSEEALQMLRLALSTKIKAVGETHYDVAVTYANMALVLGGLGRTAEAIETNERALEIFRKSLGPDHPLQAFALTNGAAYLNERERFAEAQVVAERAVALLERELEPTHLDLAEPLTAIGVSLIGREKFALALPALERALAIQRTKEPNPEPLADTLFALAKALWGANRHSERAVSLAVEARNQYRKCPAAERQLAEVDGWIGRVSPTHLSMR